MIVNVFGASEYLNVNRYLNIGQSILRLLALVMMSAIRDLTGSYTPGYVVCVILSLISLACFIGIRKRYSCLLYTSMEGFRLGAPPMTAAMPMTAMATMTRLPELAKTITTLISVNPTARV